MGFVSSRLAPRKRPCTNIIVYQCWAIVGQASVSDAPASCQIRVQRQGCRYPLAFMAPAVSLAWPQAFSSSAGSYNDPLGDWPPWLTTGSPTRLEQGQIGGGWWSEGTPLAWRPVQGCWLWDLTPARSPPVGVRPGASKTEDPCRGQGDEQLFSLAEPGAVSGSALTTRDGAGQPGQAPAAGHRSESESGRAH